MKEERQKHLKVKSLQFQSIQKEIKSKSNNNKMSMKTQKHINAYFDKVVV